MISFALSWKEVPLLMALKPLYPFSARALAVALAHLLFLPASLFLALTILLDLLLIRSAFVRPVLVFTFLPLHTCTFAFFPLATTDTFFISFFMTFIGFF